MVLIKFGFGLWDKDSSSLVSCIGDENRLELSSRSPTLNYCTLSFSIFELSQNKITRTELLATSEIM